MIDNEDDIQRSTSYNIILLLCKNEGTDLYRGEGVNIVLKKCCPIVLLVYIVQLILLQFIQGQRCLGMLEVTAGESPVESTDLQMTFITS